MVNRLLFDLDDPDDELEVTAFERAFLAELETRTAHLAEPGVSGLVHRTEAWDSLVASVDLRDPEGRVGLFDFGVHVVGDRVRGDRLHNQLYFLPERPSPWSLDATGTAEDLAARAADWFGAVLRRPLVLYVWLHEDRAYAARYVFADADETLCQMYVDRMAPPGLTGRLTSAGHVRGRNWIQTAGLPAPTFQIPIRGDLTTATTLPAGVPTPAKRGPLQGLWYE